MNIDESVEIKASSVGKNMIEEPTGRKIFCKDMETESILQN